MTELGSLLVAVVADDVTGAADTGACFRHVATPVYVVDSSRLPAEDWPWEPPRGLVVTTNSRRFSAGGAAERARSVWSSVTELRPRVVYKKIDSCLRGRIGAEVDVLLEASGCDVAFVAPAVPEQGRTTVHDVQLVHGIPITGTEFAREIFNPTDESTVSRLVAAQSRLSVGHVDLEVVEAGPDDVAATVRALVGAGCRHIVFDAVEQTHLDAVAALALEQNGRVLPVGSTGLARGMAACLSHDGVESTVARPAIGDRILFVCGSPSEMLGVQVQRFVGTAGCSTMTLAAADVAIPRRRVRGQLARAAAAALATGPLLLRVARMDSPIDVPTANGVAQGLADIVRAVTAVGNPDALFVSGGDTAHRILESLDVAAVRVDEELVPGVTLGTLVGGSANGLAVMMKAGAFGHPETLVDLHAALESMRREHEQSA